jgi:hypothetical protein
LFFRLIVVGELPRNPNIQSVAATTENFGSTEKMNVPNTQNLIFVVLNSQESSAFFARNYFLFFHSY